MAGFWRDGGERELHSRLEEFAPHSVRIATLLGSNAPLRALVAELGRIREHELGGPPNPARDAELGERIYAWFESASLSRSNRLADVGVEQLDQPRVAQRRPDERREP